MQGSLGIFTAWTGIGLARSFTSGGKTSRGLGQPLGTGFNSRTIPRSHYADWTPIPASATATRTSSGALPGISSAATFTSGSKTSRGLGSPWGYRANYRARGVPWHFGRAAVKGWPGSEWTAQGKGSCTWTGFRIQWTCQGRGLLEFPFLAPPGRRWTCEGKGSVSWDLRGPGSKFWRAEGAGVCSFTGSQATGHPSHWNARPAGVCEWTVGLQPASAACLTADGEWTAASPGTGPANRAY